MALNQFFDLFSFSASPKVRYGYIVLLSLLSAVIFLLVFKKTSNQEKITYHKNQIWGNILQMRLYQDQFRVLILSVFSIVKYNLLYIRQTLISLVFIIIPLLIFTVQVNNRCGYEPLKAGQQFIIRVGLDQNVTRSSSEFIEKVYCAPSPEITLETPPLRIEKEGNVFWRARVAASPANGDPYIRIGVQGNDSNVAKSIMTDYRQERFAPTKTKWSWWNGLLNNTEGFLPDGSPFKVVSTEYQRAGYSLLFWSVDAIILYFIFTLLFAFALKRVFHVNI